MNGKDENISSQEQIPDPVLGTTQVEDDQELNMRSMIADLRRFGGPDRRDKIFGFKFNNGSSQVFYSRRGDLFIKHTGANLPRAFQNTIVNQNSLKHYCELKVM